MNQLQFQRAAGLSDELAARWFPHIDAAMREFGIVRNIDKAMFLAQVCHESKGLTASVESFNYSVGALITTFFPKRITENQAVELGRRSGEKSVPIERQRAIANLVYQKRFGNNHPGDGWKYRGRGPMQTTFLDNYRATGNALKLDLVSNPELLEQDQHGARAAAWFYVARGCLNFPGDLEKITEIINGGSNGIDDRRARFKRANLMLA